MYSNSSLENFKAKPNIINFVNSYKILQDKTSQQDLINSLNSNKNLII